jgi:hypothetical protein
MLYLFVFIFKFEMLSNIETTAVRADETANSASEL